ncbi:MAG: hypothetical protein ACK53W_12505 [Gemmatimonadota bacterium]|jgi:hypothetical protein
MTSSMRTPGRWRAVKQRRTIAICDPSGVIVASVPYSELTAQRKTADANLLAASPALLDAAIEISDMAGQMDAHRRPPVLISYDAIIALREAIAKATAVA